MEHDILNEGFLFRYLTFEPGDPYDMERLLDLKSRYSGSDYFNYVNVAPRLRDLGDDDVPVDIKLEGRPRHGYSAGIGYGTDTGPRLLFGYEIHFMTYHGHKFTSTFLIVTHCFTLSACLR